jgi:predicted transcriptional regulator
MAAPGGFHILGDLEREIMAILWRNGRSTVRQVHRQITSTRVLAYTTIMTTMIRLAEKGLLHQERRRGAATHPHGFVYRPVVTRSELMRVAVTTMCEELCATVAERRRVVEALHG